MAPVHLCFLPPIPPSIRVFSNESTLLMRWPKYWSFIKLKKKKDWRDSKRLVSPDVSFTFQKDDETGVMETFQSYRLRVSCLRLLTSVVICLGLRNPMSTFKITWTNIDIKNLSVTRLVPKDITTNKSKFGAHGQPWYQQCSITTWYSKFLIGDVWGALRDRRI